MQPGSILPAFNAAGAVGAFESAEEDDIPAGRFIATVEHLRKLRRDADRRLENEAADEHDRLKILEPGNR